MDKKNSTNLDPDVQKLEKAWNLILDQYQKYAYNNSITNGKGLNIFKMLGDGVGVTNESDYSNHNCNYYFAEPDSWGTFLQSYPYYKEFTDAYNYKTMYPIMVSVPTSSLSEETIQTIRLFKLENHEEIDF